MSVCGVGWWIGRTQERDEGAGSDVHAPRLGLIGRRSEMAKCSENEQQFWLRITTWQPQGQSAGIEIAFSPDLAPLICSWDGDAAARVTSTSLQWCAKTQLTVSSRNLVVHEGHNSIATALRQPAGRHQRIVSPDGLAAAPSGTFCLSSDQAPRNAERFRR